MWNAECGMWVNRLGGNEGAGKDVEVLVYLHVAGVGEAVGAEGERLEGAGALVDEGRAAHGE